MLRGRIMCAHISYNSIGLSVVVVLGFGFKTRVWDNSFGNLLWWNPRWLIESDLMQLEKNKKYLDLGTVGGNPWTYI